MNLYLSILIWLAAYYVFSTFITLGLFIKIEHWKAQGLTEASAFWWQKATLAIGLLCDVLYNYTSGVVVLFQFPRRGETMFTYHLQRLVRAQLQETRLQRYRLYIAKTYCFVLNFFDVNHCRNNPT